MSESPDRDPRLGYGVYVGECRGPIDGECDREFERQFRESVTGSNTGKHYRCPECGTINSLERRGL